MNREKRVATQTLPNKLHSRSKSKSSAGRNKTSTITSRQEPDEEDHSSCEDPTMSLKDLIKGTSHTHVGHVQFDCPIVQFSPRNEVVDQCGNITVVERKRRTANLQHILEYTPTQFSHLRRCIKNYKSF